MDMQAVRVSEDGSAEGCLHMCGMCPSCVFAPNPPRSTQCLWKVSDEFKRRFVVALLLRCRHVQVLESIQRALSVTSWTLFAKSRPASRQDFPSRCSHRPLLGKPSGMDVNEVWKWLHSSPEWIQSDYLCRIFSLCDSELLRIVSNLTSVLLVREKRGVLQFHERSHTASQHDQDSEDLALMVVPGSSKSVSGVSRYRDFIGCLPVDLSKRILDLLEEHTLKLCRKVCRYWQHLTQETMEEMKFRRAFRDQIKATMKRRGHINPTYANTVEVLVPIKEDETECSHSAAHEARPNEGAHAKVKTVQLEERNVYCGTYFTKVLLDKEDCCRVLDYRGGSLMATGSKDRLVHLLCVASEIKNLAVMKGHVGSVRAVLLCEDRGLLITAACDASIRCWNLKTYRCEMMLYGHTGTINCLDVHADTLVSGAKDCSVRVWSLHTATHFEDFDFKHPRPVRCVKISKTTVYSSCDRGLVKIWNMENASLLKVIDGHRSSVRCLFFDEWHLLSGDSNGSVMAWSINCEAKECLMTFNHPKEVKSLTLVYLRVITGCGDGKIRIFNFLTGDCLKDITVETETGCILSLHFHDHSILVNTTSSVKLYQFAKVFWDYADSAPGEKGDVVPSEKSAALLRKCPLTAAGSGDVAQAPSATFSHEYNGTDPDRAELLYRTRLQSTPTKCQTRATVRCETAEQSVMLSEKAARERMKKRGLHHPLTRDSILLRVNVIQQAQCMDEVSLNMESNVRLRDSWGPHTQPNLQAKKQSLQTLPCPRRHTQDSRSRRAKTCVPAVRQAVTHVSHHVPNASQGRDVSTAPDNTRSHHPSVF